MDRIYQSLPTAQSIRLLRIQAGLESDPLRYTLFVVDSYATVPDYCALSYCWGDPEDTINSFCNEVPFPITRSLFGALCRLRRKAISRPIWADAICINQKDIPERNQQVSIMRHLYEHASQVFIWAGYGNEDLAAAIHVVRLIGHKCCESLYGTESSPGSWLSSLRQERDRTQLVTKANFADWERFTTTEWDILFLLYGSDWFFRVWVIQEVRETQKIDLLYGDQEIEWDFVALVAKWIFHVDDQLLGKKHVKRDYTQRHKDCTTPFAGVNNVSFMWNLQLRTRREAAFPALLNLVRNFKATDPRDKIFALLRYPIVPLGSAKLDACSPYRDLVATSGADQLSLQPDYELTPIEIYRAVTVRSIECYQNLEILSYVWQVGLRDESYPSWIPTWAISSNHTSWTPLLPFLYNAALNFGPIYHYTGHGCILHAQGLILGFIDHTGRTLRYGNEDTSTGIPIGCMDTEESLTTMAAILTQDRWQEDISQEHTARRASRNIQIHLDDFASYLLPFLRAYREDIYIDVMHKWCNVCGEYITGNSASATTKSTLLHNCLDCDNAEYDLCNNCWDRGVRCGGDNHRVKAVTTRGFWCPYSNEIIEVLEKHARSGDSKRFQSTLTASNRDRTFFRASQEWIGVGPHDIEPSDVLVVLFGSRVPFVLRRFETRYRLVGDCYIHGLMDGEAVQMWKRGDPKVKLEDFTIF